MLTAVTGASGHVGACLCRALVAERRSLRLAVHRDERALEELPGERVRIDLAEPRSLARAFSEVEVVYHLAATISLNRRQEAYMMATNVEGTRHVLAACAAAGVRRLVHFSSIEALSDQHNVRPTEEDNPLAQRWETTAYGWSKAQAERLVLDAVGAGLDAVILNPTAIIGPCDYKPSALGRVLISLYDRRLPVLVHGGFNWVDVRDVAAAALAAERRAAPGQRYLLPGNWRSLLELSRLVDAAAGRPRRRVAAPYGAAFVGAALLERVGALGRGQPVFTSDTLRALAKHRRVSSEKARRELGYRPRPLEESVRDALEWFRERGYLNRSGVARC